ncbi:MAG: ribonuclease III [Acetobacteraceae bacterium]|nr:ribonuclease III [Acetobacteraceae bacterium]
MADGNSLEPAPARDQLTRFEQAEELLGHRFANRGLLAESLTHRSALQPKRRGKSPVNSNERLEFIGDRVLGLLVAEWLVERFPLEPEGALGRRHAYLVSRRVLAELADRAGLSETLDIGVSEAKAGVGHLANVLADALEALMGAVYLDAGLDPARAFIRRIWGPELDAMAEPPTDPKTELQEWLMARGLPLPEYRVTSRSGPPHQPEFHMVAAGGGQEGSGAAGSKRLAERNAAADLLAKLRA